MINFKKQKKIDKKVRNSILPILILIFSLTLLSEQDCFRSSNYNETDQNQNPKSSSENSVLFQGNEIALNITDYGNLYDFNQEVVVDNQENINLTYYLDDVHNWEVSKVETQINNIQDERDWVNNGIIGSDTGLTPTSKVPQSEDSGPSYGKNLNPNNYMATFNGNDCDYMRIHFVLLEVEYYYDELYISNQDNTVLDNFAGYYTDFYTPWYNATQLKISMSSDNSVELYGYSVDFFETYNGSMFALDSTNWNYFENTINDPSRLYGGTEEIGNRSALRTVIEGLDNSPSYSYEDGDIAGFYQDFTIPRGKLIDAWVSMDYNLLRGINTNDNYAYIKVNGENVYTRGFRTITNAGLGQWHSTGLINLDLWENSSNIFDEILIGQSINLSVGIEIGNGVEYTGFDHLDIQESYFDNIQLIIKTSANSTQSGINLQFNNSVLNDDNTWGVSYLNLTGNWNINPLKLAVTTDSPSLSFDLDTTLYGYHKTKSRVGQTTLEGVSYEILKNGTILWEFSHNLYMPAQYSDFEFTIDKPENWNFISVLDPTLQSRPYEYGNEGDKILKINKENAIFPGWWTFQATSPNFLNISNTEPNGESEFYTGESTKIKTQIKYKNHIPNNLDVTSMNLTIFDPKGARWFSESRSPFSNGTVIFSRVFFDALNTSGGIYNFTIFWSNGTALGGTQSDFLLIHASSLTLLKPDDAEPDLIADAFVGDLIPLRVLLEDAENYASISNSLISYNWTSGTEYLFEAASGIYETVIDTADLASIGLYQIVIKSEILGFEDTNITLKINLGETTNLQVLDSDYNIELHANSNIIFKFTDFDGDGIDGALVNVSIINPSYYSINNPGNGEYHIEFSTLYLSQPGTYQLNFSFQATSYEPKYYTYQFQVEKQSVYMNVSVNNDGITENSPKQVIFYDKINITTNVFSQVDESAISGGNITLISGDYEFDLTEIILTKYNLTMKCNPDIFSFGINYVYLRFEHQNYKTQTFGFQLLVDQIELEVQTLGFEGTYRIDIGESFTLRIQVLDPDTLEVIENATISYTWDYGYGNLVETSPGLYEASIKLPDNLQGDFEFEIIINTGESVYKLSRESFLLVIGEPGIPEFVIWIIAIVSAIVISVLGALSLRSYVIIPRKRKKEAELVARTQNYKDLNNIQAIVVIHRLSGIPLFSKSYSILERQKKELFAGFVQAITTIGEEIAGNQQESEDKQINRRVQSIFELDFKYFYCLICDRDDIRIVLVLNEKSSEDLKNNLVNLASGITLNLSQVIEKWDGSIETFEKELPPIINQYLDFYYKEAFTLNNAEYISKIRKEIELNKMEIRVLNTIYSMAKSKKEFYLGYITETVHEENKDLIIEALESLIKKNIIISSVK